MSEDNRKVPVEVRRLSASDAVSYRDLRLDGLRAHPEAFGASWEEEAAQPLAWFANRMDRNVIFSGGPAGTSDLRGRRRLLRPGQCQAEAQGRSLGHVR